MIGKILNFNKDRCYLHIQHMSRTCAFLILISYIYSHVLFFKICHRVVLCLTQNTLQRCFPQCETLFQSPTAPDSLSHHRRIAVQRTCLDLFNPAEEAAK